MNGRHATKTKYMAARTMYVIKRTKYRWLLWPTQLWIHGPVGEEHEVKKFARRNVVTARGSHAHLQWWSNLRTQELQILQWWARSGFGRWPFGNMTVICLNTFYPCIVSNATIVPTFFTRLWVDWIFFQLQQHFSYRRLCISLLQVSIKKVWVMFNTKPNCIYLYQMTFCRTSWWASA